jgi:hypothetical protein
MIGRPLYVDHSFQSPNLVVRIVFYHVLDHLYVISGRGSLAVGGNGPGRNGESGKAGVPSQWEGTGQEERRKRESRGSLAMGGNGPGRKEKAGCRLGRKRSRSRFWS